MRFQYLFLLCLSCSSLFAQSASSARVEYIFAEQKRNLATQQSYLFNETESFCTDVIVPTEAITWSTKDDGSSTATVNFDANRKEGPNYYVDHSQRVFIAKLFLADEDVIVKDAIPQFEWSMTGQSKVVAGYTCYSAVTNFRGRKYEAFFAPDIPISSGPHKFGGLPGLILELSADEGKFTWHCKSISRLPEDQLNLISPPKGEKPISSDEYKKLYIEMFRRGVKRMEASGITIDSDIIVDEDTILELPEDHN